jgi:hypothetical protein
LAQHRIGIRENAGDTEARRAGPRDVSVLVADPDQLNVRHREYRFDVNAADAAAPDDRGPERTDGLTDARGR